MKKIFIKDDRGFAASDGLMAVIIITLFTGIISTLLYNIYLYNSSLKRMSIANSYIVDVFEYTDKVSYDDVTKDNLVEYFNNKYYFEEGTQNPKNRVQAQAVGKNSGIEINTPYRISIGVENYNETAGNEGKLDLVKEITMTVEYKLGDKEQDITIKKVKAREKFVVPNKPDISKISLQENEKVYCVKELNNNYVVCYENDSNWYNYGNNNPATVIVTNNDELKIRDTIQNVNRKNV